MTQEKKSTQIKINYRDLGNVESVRMAINSIVQQFGNQYAVQHADFIVDLDGVEYEPYAIEFDTEGRNVILYLGDKYVSHETSEEL